MAQSTPVRIPHFLSATGRRMARHVARGALLTLGLSALTLSACAQTSRPVTADADGKTAVRSSGNGGDFSVAGQFLAGRFAQDHRDLSAAARFLLEALEHDPENIDLLNRAFQVLQQEGRDDDAQDIAEQLVEKGDQNMMPRLFLAAQMAADKDYDTALAMVRSIPATRLNVIVGPMAEAWILTGLGETDEALTRLAELRKTPISGLEQLHAAMINDVAGRTEAAESGYMDTLAAQDSPPLRLAQLLGNFFSRSGKPQRAEAVYNQFLAENPESALVRSLASAVGTDAGSVESLLPDARAGFAEAMFDIASVLQRDRAHDTALMFTRMALSLKPNMPIGRVLLGEIFESQERQEAAVEAYKSIEPDGPFGWTAQLRTADLLDRLDRTDEALVVLDRMAAARPARWDMLHRKGDILRSRERFAEAVVAYDGALARVDQIEERHWGLLYARGISLERSKQWNRAEADFLKALELQPEQAYVLNYLGYSWVEMDKNLDKALDMIERAVAQRPNDGYIVDSLGWVYYKLGRYEEAVVELEKATAIRPHDPTINDHLGDAYWKVGRFAEARFQWRRSLGLDPDAELQAKIETKIERGLVEAMPAAVGKGGKDG